MPISMSQQLLRVRMKSEAPQAGAGYPSSAGGGRFAQQQSLTERW